MCDEHHWVSRHQPGLPLYWIDQCSLCGDFNAERMAEQIAHVREPSGDGNDDGLRARIEALCDEAESRPYGDQMISPLVVRAALDGPDE